MEALGALNRVLDHLAEELFDVRLRGGQHDILDEGIMLKKHCI